MESRDVVILGAGISGASFAHYAGRAGRNVLLLERDSRLGGALHTVDGADEFWFELGGHTFYNSYGATLALLEECDALSEIIPRSSPILRFLDNGEVLPGKNLGLLMRQFGKLEFLRAIPRWFGGDKSGATIRSHFSKLVGKRNYERILGPLLSAVPSQSADEFPADLLFKKRPRRKEFPRSFTFRRGARTLIETTLRSERIETRLSQQVERINANANGFELHLADGGAIRAKQLTLAIPPKPAAKLLADVDTTLATRVEAISQTSLESLGLVLRADRVALPEATFFIPLEDRFHSIVTRDVVPHPSRRAFTFHFKPEVSRAERLERATSVLQVSPESIEASHEAHGSLPSPRLGHHELIAKLDESLAGRSLALTGNWFGGLSIEDCVLRSESEWRRVKTPC